VRSRKGRLDAAFNAYEESLALLQEASSRTNDRQDVLYELAQTHFYIADIHYRRLDYKAAEQEIIHYRDLSGQLATLSPENMEFQLEVAYAENNLGSLAFQTNNPKEARNRFKSALAIKKELATAHPRDMKLQAELADTMSWLGSVESSVGNVSAAIDWHRKELQLRQNLVSSDADFGHKDKLALAYRSLAGDLFSSNDVEGSANLEQQASNIYRKLVIHDTQNAIWRVELYRSLRSEARARLALGWSDGVEKLLSEARQGLEIELARNPTDGRIGRDRAAVGVDLAKLSLLEKAPDKAVEFASDAMARMRSLLVDHSDDIEVGLEFARAAYLLAESSYAVNGNNEESKRTADSALRLLENFANSRMEIMALRALLLEHAGRESESQELIDQLILTEYRAPEYLPGNHFEDWYHDIR
jgi:tetratricopeptide (TPR) repeat protein